MSKTTLKKLLSTMEKAVCQNASFGAPTGAVGKSSKYKALRVRAQGVY